MSLGEFTYLYTINTLNIGVLNEGKYYVYMRRGTTMPELFSHIVQ